MNCTPFVRLSVCCLAFSAAIFSVSSLAAQAGIASAPKPDPRIPQILDALGKVTGIAQTAISPDGQHLAWVVRGKGVSTIMLGGPEGQDARLVEIAGKNKECSAASIAFSPDSKRLAFLSDCGSAAGEVKPGEGKITQDDLFVLPVIDPRTDGGKAKAKQISHLHGYVHEPAWSPDGKEIGVLYVEGATRPSGALDAMKPPSGVIGVEGLEVQRVAAIDALTGQMAQVTPAGLHVYEFDWSPDSKQLAYIAAAPPGENNWWVAKLYTQPADFATQSQPKVILDPVTIKGSLHGLQIAVPRWSPDGTRIAFIGGIMSDQGATGGEVYLIFANGGTLMKLPTQDDSPAWFQWMSKTQLLITSVDKGQSRIATLDMDDFPTKDHLDPGERFIPTLKFTTLATLPASIGDGRLELSVSLSNNGTAAYVSTSYDHAPEVFMMAGKGFPQQITHLNETLKPSWGKAESITWTNDGFDVQGWLLLPADYDANKKYPMIVMVHGGPSSAVVPHWPGAGFGGPPFSALGYFVLMPNPRGSYGEGEKFTQANVKDFGYGDLRDILAGVDAVEKKYPVDDKRLGLTGWSYGGFMTMFGITQTNRFHAAVAGAGISNWQSYYGENSIDQWMLPFFGASVYDDPKVYAKSSAIEFIQQAKTPTLVVVGDRDGECPSPQSFEFWHALKAEKVPVELVVYPNEGHAFRLPDHRTDVLERALNWFQQYMQ